MDLTENFAKNTLESSFSSLKILYTERKTSQSDKYLVILSSKTYVFEDKLTRD